jgi:hypothetical protein
MIYLNTYRPLIGNDAGVAAVQKYGIAPYVDSSCRREPDLEHPKPAISECQFRDLMRTAGYQLPGSE